MADQPATEKIEEVANEVKSHVAGPKLFFNLGRLREKLTSVKDKIASTSRIPKMISKITLIGLILTVAAVLLSSLDLVFQFYSLFLSN